MIPFAQENEIAKPGIERKGGSKGAFHRKKREKPNFCDPDHRINTLISNMQKLW